MAESVFSSENPASGAKLADVSPTPVDEVAQIVARARAAQPEWAARSLDERAERNPHFHSSPCSNAAA